jgi:hypothetical protein
VQVVDPAPTRIVVELVPGVAPITGRIHARAQASRPFTGWTGLFAALRTATGEGADSTSRTGELSTEAEGQQRIAE